MEGSVSYESRDEQQLNLKATELRLGLPGSGNEEPAASPPPTKKRASPEQDSADEECRSSTTDDETSRPSK